MKKTTEKSIERLRKDIAREAAAWIAIRDHGCNDPYWTDGNNLNLTRNHIIDDKRQLRELCEGNGMDLPDEYYLPTPPEAENDYMANMRQKERVDRLKLYGHRLNRKKTEI